MPRSGPKRGGKSRGGGSGAHRGRGGRGRGRGSGGRGGRGRNQKSITSSYDHVYEHGHRNIFDDNDDLDDDFKLFGHFDAVNEPTDEGMTKPRKRKILDHRTLLAQDEERMAMGSRGNPAMALSSSTKTVAFTRSSAILYDEDDVQPEDESDQGNCIGSSTKERVFLETTEERTPDRVIGVQGTEDGSLGFFFDSTPGEVVFAPDNSSSAKTQAKVNSKSEKAKQKKKKQKKKIIRGDDIYLSSESDDSDDDRILFSNASKYDDDLAVMQDYIENMQLDEEDKEAMRRFAHDVDGNYDDLLDNAESDGKDDIHNGAFDHESSDESILEHDEDSFEMDEKAFKNSLSQALNDVPPSLRNGMRNRLKYETKQVKNIAKKEKQLEKRAQKNKDKDKSKMPDLSFNLRKIDMRIQNFIMDNDITSYQFAPMPKDCRRQVHLIAAAYKLKSHSLGSGTQRMTTLQKTKNTFLPTNRRYIERFLSQAQNNMDLPSTVLRKHRMDFEMPGKNSKKDKKGKKKAQDTSSLSKPELNSVVGSGAQPLDESNVGHRMLAAMGWKQGDTLGTTNDGLAAPIEVIIRKKRTGLGS